MTTICASSVELAAQGYYNLDAGRPTRVEDASPTPRHELDVQLATLRWERFSSGAQRWRVDPKLSFGISPFTEVEIRTPLSMITPAVANEPQTIGLGGLAVGATHALLLETGAIPAVAVAGEWLAPVGGLAASVGAYSAKLLATKTFARARFHVNAGAGTWSIRRPVQTSTCPQPAPGSVPPPGCGTPPPVIDTPCARVPSSGAAFLCAPVSNANATAAGGSLAARADTSRGALVGSRFVAGLGVDHAFALSSTLISADVVAEKFVDLYDSIDLSAEVGLRRQLTPRLVLDVGIGRHFNTPTRSNAATLGFSYETSAARARVRERVDR
jgi:hypothetical protein